MIYVESKTTKPIEIGIQGENDAREIQFNITPWADEYGEGDVTAAAKRPKDSVPYPATVTTDGTTVTWKPNDIDTAQDGVGSFQLEYRVDGIVAKTRVWNTYIDHALSPTGPAPEPVEDWLEEMREIEASAIQAAQDAEDSADAAAASAAEAETTVSDVRSDLDYIITCGKNMYDKSANTPNSQINSAGDIIPYAGYSVSEYINVEAETTYTFSHDGIAENGWISKLACYASDGTLLSYTTPLAVFTTPAGCARIRFYTSTVRMDGNLQLEKGSSATFYEPYTIKLKIEPEISTIENKILPSYTPHVVNGIFISKVDGQIATSGSYGATDYIAVNGGEEITVYGYKCPSGTNASVCAYDENFTFLSAIITNETDSGKGKKITLGSTVSYIRVSANYNGSAKIEFNSAEVVSKETENAPLNLGTLTTPGYISKLDGGLLTNSQSFSATDYISCTSTHITIMNPVLWINAGICEYDENKTFISCLLSNKEKGAFTVQLSPNAKYIRASVPSSNSQVRIYLNNGTNNDNTEIINAWKVATGLQIKHPYARINALKPTITFIDDDTMRVDAVQRYHGIFDNLGVKGCYAVVTRYLEQNDNLKNLLLGYEDEGFGMLFHAEWQDTYYMIGANRDIVAAEADYCAGLRKMRTFGFLDYNYWVSPYGVMDAEIQAMCKRHGAKCLLSTSNNTYIGSNGINGKAEAVDRYGMPRCSLGYSDAQYPSFTLADLKAQIDKCVLNNGWLIITTHVQQWATEYGDTPDQRLADVIQYAIDSGCDIKTFSEAYMERNPVLQMNDIC